MNLHGKRKTARHATMREDRKIVRITHSERERKEKE